MLLSSLPDSIIKYLRQYPIVVNIICHELGRRINGQSLHRISSQIANVLPIANILTRCVLRAHCSALHLATD